MTILHEIPRGELRGITFEDYPAHFGAGELLSRSQVAKRVGKAYSTVMYHLERAVSAGIIHKQYGFIKNQPGWVYGLPDTLPRLFGER